MTKSEWRVNVYCPNGHVIALVVEPVRGIIEVTECPTCYAMGEAEAKREERRAKSRIRRWYRVRQFRKMLSDEGTVRQWLRRPKS